MPSTPTPADLFDRIASFENLHEAALEARKGKRYKDETARFHQRLGQNLVQLRDELLSGAYQPGEYRTFWIQEPVRRQISAAPYRDRVVHHALCRVTQPLLERSFIFDSYANRTGKGTHAALDRCTEYARRFQYVLQCDIRLFFPSIDHGILLDALTRRIGEENGPALRLIAAILGNSNPQPPADFYFPGDLLWTPGERRKGLPIGNLTSQLWANFYLDPFDHFIKDRQRAPGYVRYVDDFLIFSDDKAWLHDLLDKSRERLAPLRLLLHPRKCRLYPVSEGIPFLGFRVFPRHRRLPADSVTRAGRRLRRLAARYHAGEVGTKEVRQSVHAWIAHASHGDTTGLRRTMLRAIPFRASGRNKESAGRLVEQ